MNRNRNEKQEKEKEGFYGHEDGSSAMPFVPQQDVHERYPTCLFTISRASKSLRLSLSIAPKRVTHRHLYFVYINVAIQASRLGRWFCGPAFVFDKTCTVSNFLCNCCVFQTTYGPDLILRIPSLPTALSLLCFWNKKIVIPKSMFFPRFLTSRENHATLV